MTRHGNKHSAKVLAEWLVAFEDATHAAEEGRPATCRVCEKLRRPLIHMTGPAGFRSLLSRALTLAQREAPALNGVRVTDAGALENFIGEAVHFSSRLVAHLIELLTTFIGESLTLRLLHDIWPDLPASESQPARKDIM